MSLPAAPVAVLVLAWDETTPAVRALVEATEVAEPMLDSVVVLVPAGTADAEEVTQEEFLPLDVLPELPLATPPLPAEPAAAPLAPEVAAAAPPALPVVESFALAASPAPARLLPLAAPTSAPALPASAAPNAVIAEEPGPVAVRVLRLSHFSLPELAEQAAQALPLPIWRGSLAAPAAPYLGSIAELAAGASAASNQFAASFLPSSTSSSSAFVPPAPPLPAAPSVELPTLPRADASALPSYLPSEPPEVAIDAEPDLAPVRLPEEADLLASTATEEPLATEFAPAQANWPAALASLREPAPLEEATAVLGPESEADYYAETEAPADDHAPPTPAAPVALRPTSSQFEAPNLNFQVIQYARFAVPVALAEAPFDAIYAPAWPTWLAAQELRQRTGQPLVLHVATLAASPTDSLELAAGWQAELQRQALHRADLILAETPALALRLRHDLGLPASLVRIIAAADSTAIAQALHTARLRPSGGLP